MRRKCAKIFVIFALLLQLVPVSYTHLENRQCGKSRHGIHRPCGIARSAVFIQQKIQITGGNKNG